MKNDDNFEPLSELGEEDVGGSEEELEKDDNALDAVHEMGLAQNASESDPKPLGIGEDILNADAMRQGRPPTAQKYSGEIGGEKYETNNK